MWPAGDGSLHLGGLAPAPSPEPAHPTVLGGHFIVSTSAFVDKWRLGVWRLKGGRYVISAFVPDAPDAPRPVLQTTLPVIGIYYLGAPDARGGVMTILQRVARHHYRWAYVSWGEKGLRRTGS